MNTSYYILNEKGEVVVETDLLKWAEWFENTKNRVVIQNIVGEYEVSTIFLGLDHDFEDKGVPVLWETLVFENKLTEVKFGNRTKKVRLTLNVGDTFRRYTSKVEALKGHKEVMAYVASFVEKIGPAIGTEEIEPEFPEAEIILTKENE